LARQFYGLSFGFQLLSTPRHRDAVTFNSWREAPPQRDFHPPIVLPQLKMDFSAIWIST
jgi:hypothetical protein